MKLKQVFNHHKHEEEQQIEIIKNSEFFDTKWYLEKNPDVKSRKMSAARHYLKNGWKENRNPSPKFSTREYLKKYPECKICPLVFEYNRNSFVDLAICAIMKNEGLYVKEWVDYHRLVGVKRFYIYDNESTDNMKEVLAPYIEQGVVVYKYQEGINQQKTAYQECLKKYNDKAQWIAFIDADEFIVPKKKNTLPEILKDYEEYPALGINWVNFDSNGHENKLTGGILENYTRTYYNLNLQTPHRIKSIIQPKMTVIMGVHNGDYIDQKYAVTEDKEPITEKNTKAGAARSFTNTVSVKKIQINHYYSKSEEEYIFKIGKGLVNYIGGNTKKKAYNENHVFYTDYKYDYSVYKYVIALKPELKLRETIRYFWLKLKNLGLTLYHPFNKNSVYRYFDKKWYLKQYPDAQKSSLSAIDHYNMIGWAKGYNPSPNFNTNDYLREHPDITKLGFNPLCHFLSYSGKFPVKSIEEKNDKKTSTLNADDFVDLAICAIIKNEAPYVKEWIDYHRLVGVKKFYIYDNESTDNLKEILTPYIEKGIVVYKYYPGKSKQIPAYNNCLKNYKDKMQWLAFIDIDEFIVPKEKDTIPEFLKDFEQYPGVGINWIMFDSNGHKKKPETDVLESYTRIQYNENNWHNSHIKSIVQPKRVDNMSMAHYCEYINNEFAVTENKEEIKDEENRKTCAFTNRVSVKKIQINHYYCKSEEEAEKKVAKGRVDSIRAIKPIKQSELNFADYKYDYSVCKYLIQLKPENAVKERIKYIKLKLLNQLIKAKHLFNTDEIDEYINEKWYFKQYPEAKESGLSAKDHYLQKGWIEGYNPSVKFDTDFYLKKYPDVAKVHMCPLLHYIANGKREGRLPLSDTAPQTFKDVSVTVITPTYNRLQYLEKAIKMLKAQTLPNIKFIIVDDGSTDGSAAYIEQATQNDNRFTLIKNTKNIGPSAARNKAFPLVDSNYIGFFDIDDEIPADYFEKLSQSAQKSHADIIFTNYNTTAHRINNIKDSADKFAVLRNGAIWDKLYKTELLKNNKILFAEKLLTADNLFNVKAFYYAKKIQLVDEPRYQYFVNEDSVGKDAKHTEKRKKDIITICKKVIKFANKQNADAMTKIAMKEFLSLSYQCYLDDSAFRTKLEKTLRHLTKGINIKFKKAKKYSQKEYDLVANSEYFDAKYYRSHNPELWLSNRDLLTHYLTTGWLEGKNPSAAFDGNRYLADYPDVDKAGVNPLIHYLGNGVNEHRNYYPVEGIFSKLRYALEYPIRVKEEYDRLTAEIKALENMK